MADKDKKKDLTGSKPALGRSAKDKTEAAKDKKAEGGKRPPPAGKRGQKAQPAAARKKAKKTKTAAPPPSPADSPVPTVPDVVAPTHGHGWKIDLDGQRKAGLVLIASSLLVVGSVGAWLSPYPASGAASWILKGFAQAAYLSLMALFPWTFFRRRKYAVSYLLPFGIFCIGIAVWDTGSGIYANRVRLEANDLLINFRDTPLNVNDLVGAIERNPYVEAYIIMRDTHWELSNRLDSWIAGYAASYRTYVGNGEFLDVGRLRSRLELWRAFYQISDLEDQLTVTENSPVETGDLLWTTSLLDVDEETRNAYSRDLQDAVRAATESQARLISRERRTLARIKHSLQVLIDAEGRYRFAEGKVVFDDPADAARFAGKDPPKD